MKKKITAYLALALASVSVFASCGGNGGNGGGLQSSEEPGTSSGGGNGNMISAQPLSVQELGEGFNAAYLPDVSSINQLSGKIDVCLDFEGTQSGWRALANEY